MDEKEQAKIEKIGMKLDKLDDKLQEEEELKRKEQEMRDEIADPSIFEHYKDEFNAFDQLGRDLENLYSQTKEHYDAMLNNRARGTLNFIQGQTSNLVSIKSAQIQVLREKSNLKRNILDSGFRKKSADKDSSSSVGVAMEIMRQLVKSDADEKPTIIDVEAHEVDNLDEVVQELEEAGKIKYSESEMNPKAVLNVEKTIRSIISADPNDLKGDKKVDASGHGTLTPLEYMEQNMEDEYMEYKELLDNTPDEVEEEITFSDNINEEIELEDEEDFNFDIVVGISSDRQQWKFIAVDKSTGEFINDPYIEQLLPDRDCVDMKLIPVNGELTAVISDGTSYPFIVIDFD